MAVTALSGQRWQGSGGADGGTQTYNASTTNVTLSGGSDLTATADSSTWGNRAYSTKSYNPNQLGSGETFRFIFTTADATKNGFMGFDSTPTTISGHGNDGNSDGVDYGFYLVGNGASANYLAVSEQGDEKYQSSSSFFTTSTYFMIEVNNSGVVKYYADTNAVPTALLYTSLTAMSGDFYVLFYPYDSGFNTTITSWSNGRVDDKASVTDVPAGSEFEQTNDYKSYQWGGSADGLGSSANATNNGATANVATAIDGKASLDFDGSNDWINLGTPLNAVIDGEALSISAWVYVTATDITDQTIIGKQIAGYSSPYHVFNFRAHSGDWAFTTNDGSSYTGDATTAISHTGWTHIIATFDGTDEFKVYADNVEVCSATVSGTNWSNSYWSLGNGEGTTRWWDSTIQDVAFWSRVLTSGERATLLNSYAHGTATSSSNTGLVATSISTAGLRAYYTLNDTTAGVKNSAVGWVERGTAI